jgi:hypothetical protein
MNDFALSYVESTIPEGMTLSEYRRARNGRSSRTRRRWALRIALPPKRVIDPESP